MKKPSAPDEYHRKGVSTVNVLVMDFMITVMADVTAGVILYFICKWLDRKFDGSSPKK